MDKNTILTHKISVIILNLKVVNLDRCFKNLVLYPFNNNKFAVAKYKLIALIISY